VHLKELKRIKDFLTGKSELNFKTISISKGKGKIDEPSSKGKGKSAEHENEKWCDTRISPLPMYKKESSTSGLNVPLGKGTPEQENIARVSTSNSFSEIEEDHSTPLLGRHN
jgi:hypothetical protein